jgi:nickel transport protein
MKIARGNWWIVGYLCLFWVFHEVPDAEGHRVNVFAWVEDGQVHTQSKFSGGKKVSGGEISVLDMEGNLLLKGQTDENGEFSFQAPFSGPMKILLKAGMGHQGEWALTEADFGSHSADVSSQAADTAESKPEKPASAADPTESGMQTISPDLIEHAVEKALDKKLQPLIHLLAESREPKPTLSDIVGGIGYIIGLVGLGAFFNARRNRRNIS